MGAERIAGMRLVAVGAINAALAIVAGAFGAHALRGRLDARALEIFETASRYHMFHAIGIVIAGILAGRGMAAAVGAGWIMQGGVVLFSGSLYALALSHVKMLGAVTPIGGVALMIAWGLVAWGAVKSARARD